MDGSSGREIVLALRVAGTIFGLMYVAQLLRLVTRAEVLIAGYKLPLWVSLIAVVISGGLSVWMWWLSRRVTK